MMEVYYKNNPNHDSNSKRLIRAFRNIFPPFPTRLLTDSKTYKTYMDFVLDTSYVFVSNFKSPRKLDLSNLRNETRLQLAYINRSYFVGRLDFNENQLNKVWDVYIRIPINFCTVSLEAFSTQGIRRVQPGNTAYVHRNTPYAVVAFYSGPNEPFKVNACWEWIQVGLNFS